MASTRIVIAGASSLLGAELKSLLEESHFAASDFRLVDEDPSVGTLTEAAGEAAVIQPVEEDSFNRADLIFFTGSAQFTRTNLDLARRSGATIIDLSGETISQSSSAIWFTNLELLQPKPAASTKKMFAIPGAPAIAAATLSLALAKFTPEHLTLVALQSAPNLAARESKSSNFKPASFSLFNPSVRPSSVHRSALISSTASARKAKSLSLALAIVSAVKLPPSLARRQKSLPFN